jgi:hypothetical protein
MSVCMIVCHVLYILSYVLCYFTIGVCQLEHVYESLYDCVSCPVYIVVRLVLFHYRCVSVRACVWAFVWLCVVLYILSYVLCYFTIGVCQLEHVYESLYDCVLSSIYCRASYVIELYVYVSESMCMKVCMIVCLVLYILSYILCYFIICVCQLHHVYESLYDCVLSCIYCCTSCVISL